MANAASRLSGDSGLSAQISALAVIVAIAPGMATKHKAPDAAIASLRTAFSALTVAAGSWRIERDDISGT